MPGKRRQAIVVLRPVRKPHRSALILGAESSVRVEQRIPFLWNGKRPLPPIGRPLAHRLAQNRGSRLGRYDRRLDSCEPGDKHPCGNDTWRHRPMIKTCLLTTIGFA